MSKRLLLLAPLAMLGLSACVVVPYHPYGHVRVAPPPPAYVAPYPHGHYHPRWRRHYWR